MSWKYKYLQRKRIPWNMRAAPLYFLYSLSSFSTTLFLREIGPARVP